MSLPTHNWRYRRTEYRFYAQIVKDIKPRNLELKDNTKKFKKGYSAT